MCPFFFLDMCKIYSQLEYLPNEILMYIFKYFDARDLFHAFYNLNSRLNVLLQSLNYLSLTLLKFNSNEINNYQIFAPYIYTLKIDYAVNIDLNIFTNIHRLILISPTSNQLKQILFNSLPYLEHITIGYEHFLFTYYITDICEKIFSNHFPHLTSCYLFEPRIQEIIPNLTQPTQLCIIKLDNIDIFIYQTILSLCPNLYFFQFTILNQHEQLYHIKPHLKLKKLKIKFQNLMKIFSDFIMISYLSCVPNLEQLNIYEINFDVNIKEYLNYQWFVSIIHQHLLLLQQYKYYLYIYGSQENNKNIINDIRIKFKSSQKNRYQSQLSLHLS